MHVVGHDHERVQLDLAPELRRPQPFLPDRLAIAIEQHLPIDNLAKEALTVVRNQSKEVGAGLGVITPYHHVAEAF